MKKTYAELQAICVRKTKTANDATALLGFQEDINIALGIVASIINPEPLYKSDTLSLTSGIETYDLASDVATIEQVKITSPTTSEKVLVQISKERAREFKTANDSHATPNWWYFDEPTFNTDGTRTLRISFYPISEQAYTVTYSYSILPTVLANSGDYPFFDQRFHHILADYAIWQYAESEPDPTLNPAYWKSKWDEDIELVKEATLTKSKHLMPIRGPVEILDEE